MSEQQRYLPETFLRIVRKDFGYGIFMLEGEELIFFPAWPFGEWDLGEVHHSNRHRRATDAEMAHYLVKIGPRLGLETARKRFWRSLDNLGKEGSREKEIAIEERITHGYGRK